MRKQNRPKIEDTEIVQSVDRALQLLSAFETDLQELSIQQFSEILNLPKSTVHRLITTLVHRGFVEQDSQTRNYRLGLRLYALGTKVVATRGINSEAAPVLRELIEQCGETASVSVLDDTEAVIIEKIESNQTIRVTSQIGNRNPLHCTGSGKVFMAYANPEVVDKILKQISPLKRYTKNTITDPIKLKENLAEIKARGYALDDEEIFDDQFCISAPVRNSKGEVFAAITVSGPLNRIKAKEPDKIGARVVEAADELSRRLGWIGK